MIDHESRIDATEARLYQAARELDCWMSGDRRVGECDLAKILGWNIDAFRQLRGEGKGPRWYRLGGGGHRITIRLSDAAVWIEEACEKE